MPTQGANIPSGDWINISSLFSLETEPQYALHNNGPSTIHISEQISKPGSSTPFIILSPRTKVLINVEPGIGIWVTSYMNDSIVAIEEVGAKPVSQKGEVDENNSSSTLLGISEVFTGTKTNILNGGIYFISVFSDVGSATDGLSIEQSSDGINWDHSDAYTIPSGVGKNYSINPFAKFARVVYTNGGIAQNSFRLQVISKGNSLSSSHRIQDPITDEDDAELFKSIITGQQPDGVFENVKINPDQALFVTNFLFEIARGNVPGMKLYPIPGRKDSLNTSSFDDLTQIPGNVSTPRPGGIQLEVVSSSPQDGIAGTGILTLDLHYLDSSFLERIEIITMNGTTPVLTSAIDIEDVQWSHAKTLGLFGGASVGNIEIRTAGGGTIFEYIQAGGNQSLSARYKVPSDKTGFIVGWQASAITKKIDLRLRADVERFDRSLLPGVFLFQDISVLNDGTSGYIPFQVPLMMPSLSTVKMSAVSAAAGGDGAGQFDILLIDN
jgi:hypothetical protein